MRTLASVETTRVVEGAVGAVLLAAVLGMLGWQALRWWRARRVVREDPGTPALARFADTETTDPTIFGGGAWSARVRRRRDTVTYGYLAVVEEYASEDSGGRWCTLTLQLPGHVPFVVADNRAAAGRTQVPMAAPERIMLDDPPFDATYLVGAEDEESGQRVLSAGARDVLLRVPVQRFMLRESQLLVRTFDGVTLDEQSMAWLGSLAARVLASTPSFVTAGRAAAASDAPLPEGRYGPS